MSDEEIGEQKATNPFIAGQFMAYELESFVNLDKVKAWNLPLGIFGQYGVTSTLSSMYFFHLLL